MVLAIACASLAAGAKDDLVLVSAQSDADGGNGGDDTSSEPAISADGRYVAFSSVANNLSNNDDDTYINVFERDLQTNTTILVSRVSASLGGAGANGPSLAPSISADGRYVAFASTAANLVNPATAHGDGDNFNHIFVRDTQTNTTTLADRGSAPGNAFPAGESVQPSISADGRYVAFTSSAFNLTPSDNNAKDDIFRRDLQTNTTILLSKQSDPAAGSSNGHSAQPSISADGRYVAFQSAATVLSSASTNGLKNVFVRDIQTNTTTFVNQSSDADGGHAATGGDSDIPAISPDGRYVAFRSKATNLSNADPNSQEDIYLRDTQAGTTKLVSRESDANGGQVGDGVSADPSVSNGGRYVVFDSTAGNLSTSDNDPVEDIFLRDTQGATTTLVSHQSPADGGAAGTGNSAAPAITPDGRYVTFVSVADNLSLHDENGIQDVFVSDLLGDPTTTPTTTTPGTTTTTTPTDTTAPDLRSSSATSPQRLGKSLTVTVLSDEDASVDANATAKPKGHVHGNKKPKKLRFQATSADVKAGAKTKIRIKPLRRTSRKLKHAKKGKAKIVLTATDAAGNTGTDTLKVKLR